MPNHGFAAASDEGLIALDGHLDQGAWQEVPDLTPDQPAHTQPVLAVHKARIRYTIRAFVASRVTDLAAFDDDWDRTQRRLSLTLSLNEESADPNVRDAARRVRDKLLQGGRIQQTQLSYGDEVEFGEAQVLLAQDPAIQADLERLGLLDILAEVKRTTQQLREALLLNQSKRTASERSLSTRRARTAVHDACNDTLDILLWLKTQPQHDADTLDALIHTLRNVIP